MWYKIKKGLHRAFPLSLGIHKGKTSESYEVIFDESCRYIPDAEGDWNKLVGWSYGILPKIKFEFESISSDGIDWKINFIPAHHIYSTRIAWRYLIETDNIELCNYHYFEGKRVLRCFRTVPIREKVIITHDMTESSFKPMLHKWGYNLGLWFGGQASAQHDTRVFIKKL
jgi:hypothetical protein